MSFNKLRFVLLSLAFTTFAQAQITSEQNILDSFAGKFITAIRTHEKNRAYLVTGKSVYTPGESVWFNAFLLRAISEKISTKADFLFVDMVNENDSVMTTIILDAAHQQLNSRIVLPNSVSAGNYWLRAYTRQMAESDTGGISVRPIYITSKTDAGTFDQKSKKTTLADSTLIMNFYPEGGSIMTGINTTIALGITDKNGAPVTIEGFIRDSRDSITARFTTNKSGLAKFEFEPSRLRKYKGVITWHGKEISYPLPSFNFFSAQLAVSSQADSYKLRILLEDSIYRKDFVTYLIAVSKDSLVFASIGKGLYEVEVNKQRLPDGITAFYLFDKDFKMLSERSVYIHDNNLRIKAATDKSLYRKRDKVTLNLSVTDAAGHLIPSLMSVSVIDTLISDPFKQCSFQDGSSDYQSMDNLLIGSNKCLTDDETDLMMLARKANYPMLSKRISRQDEESSDSLLYIKGTVLSDKNEPADQSIITLFSNSANPVLYSDTTDNKGHFRIPIASYSDSTQFVTEVRNFKGILQKAKITFDPLKYPKVNTPVALKQYLPLQSEVVKRYLSNYYSPELIAAGKSSLLPVTVRTPKKVNYDVSKRVSASSAILASDDLTENNSVGNSVLKIGGLHLLNGFLVINGLTSLGAPNSGSEPMLLVDGAQVFPSSSIGEGSPVISYLNSLNAKDIDFIEVLKSGDGANYGIRGGNGVILVNMLGKRRELNPRDNNLQAFYAKGISNPVLFPAINYLQKDLKTTGAPDTRSTLFWNGNFISDDTRNGTLTFYTSDIPATYRATITGVTIHGDFIYKTIDFQSK